MNKKIDVSIIIINYNKPEFTKSCVLSILEHTTKLLNYEIIIVDNASSMGDISILENIDKRIKIIKSNQNLGFSKGNNLGIGASCGDVILLLNNDTVLFNDAISMCYNVLLTDNNIGVVGCQLLNADGTVQPSAEYFPTLTRLFKQVTRLSKYLKNVKSNMMYAIEDEKILQVDWLWGTFYMFNRSLLFDLPNNKLPDDFFMYSEDLQWGYEISKLNLKFIYVSNAKVYHLQGDNSAFNNMLKKNLYFCLKKYKGNLYQIIYSFIDTSNFYISNLFRTLTRRNND